MAKPKKSPDTPSSRGESRNDYEKILKETNSEYSARQLKNRRDWYQRNKEAVKLAERTRNKIRMADPSYREQRKYSRILRQYGLTREAYDNMVAAGCAICGSTDRLHVDHCHTNGHVRGILCHSCNIGLGFLERTDDWATKAFEYIKAKPRYDA